ncbi:hypothetical protein [uncultured Deinococcus sp.]|uniref:hypothetical protein n=1 Tax=uncultured Deinococcus sp. TaxID=158789 RepID=UPI002586DA18|nr:hypothetical protein [uncultured Deinococcus sp.]
MSSDKPVFIVDGVQVYADGKPVVQEPAQTSVPAGGKELEKLRAEKGALSSESTRLRDANEALTLQVSTLKRQRDTVQQDLEKASEDHRLTLERLMAESRERVAALDLATQERNTAQAEAASVREALARAQSEGGDTLAQVSTLTSKVAELEARKVLPSDALERIKKVSGVADKYAQPILDALTAPASPPSE